MQTAPSRRQLALIGGGGGEGGGVELGTTDREHCQIVVSTGHESAPPQYSSDPEVSNIILLVKTLFNWNYRDIAEEKHFNGSSYR